jgi:hypothetical protein
MVASAGKALGSFSTVGFRIPRPRKWLQNRKTRAALQIGLREPGSPVVSTLFRTFVHGSLGSSGGGIERPFSLQPADDLPRNTDELARHHGLVKTLDILDPQSELTTASEIALHGLPLVLPGIGVVGHGLFFATSRLSQYTDGPPAYELATLGRSSGDGSGQEILAFPVSRSTIRLSGRRMTS